jgi:hypothetical protein
MRYCRFSAAIATAAGISIFFLVVPGAAQDANGPIKSLPKDDTPYARPANDVDQKLKNIHPKVFLSDVVVSNTDPTLKNSDLFNDGELSIAINPANHDEIVITSFAGGWGTTAPIWHSLDGGATWTKRFTVPTPPGVPSTGCPCDQTIDYGRNNFLAATFLTVPTNVYTASSLDPASVLAWVWPTAGGITQRTNLTAANTADQPWLLVNRDAQNAGQDNTYVAYDNFSGGPSVPTRVSVSYGSQPPTFTMDVQTGASVGSVNPGHRLAKDIKSGAMYSLFQRNIAPGPAGSKNIDYMLNRSLDGGGTWPLGSGAGIVVANANSTQPWPKFGTVNALLGGALHAATDPTTGDLYYVYGNRDSGTGKNRLAIRRLTTNSRSDLTIGPEYFVTDQVEAAIPSIAVTPSGAVGVFFYTFDGISTTSYPIFSAHIAISKDRGVSWDDTTLLTFQSSAQGTGNLFDRQRVLGDYMQLKVAGGTFYGAFTGNGFALGRPFANHDPIFYKVQPTGPPR